MKRSVDVALFVRWMKGGGAERVTANIAAGLAHQGLAIDLVMTTAQGPFLADVPPAVNVIDLAVQSCELTSLRLRYHSHTLQLPTGLQSVRSLLKLVDYLQTYQPAVLIAATHYLNEIAIIAKHLARVKTRIIVAEHTTLSLDAKYAEPLSTKLTPLTARMLYPFADDVVAVSQGVAHDLKHTIGVKAKAIEVLYNPVITEQFYQQAQMPIEHDWFLTPDVPIVIGCGRFVRQKDFATLLRAFADMRQHQVARLILLGDGPEASRLKQLAVDLGIASDVWFPGFVDNPYAYMAKATLFVSSSVWEGLPTVLIEAMALKVPIVATDCPSGSDEILKQGEYGDLVGVGNVAAMAAAMRQALQGHCKLISASHVAQFTTDAAISRYLNLLRKHQVKVQGALAPPLGTAGRPMATPQLAHAFGYSRGPLVSVIIPAYRAARLIGEALASVTAQTYPHWEIIVVEDGTADGTAEQVAALTQTWGSERVRYHRHPHNQGLSATRNTAIELARGEYIALLDHDDRWQPHHLATLVPQLQASKAHLAYAQAEFFEDGCDRSLGICGPNADDLAQFPASLLRKNFIPVCSVVMHKQVWQTLGGFDTALKRVEDLDFWLRAIEAGFQFVYIPETTCGYRQSNPMAMTANKAEILEWHAIVLRKNRAMTAVPAYIRGRVLARTHFGVTRRALKGDRAKAWQFFLWSWQFAPIGAILAMIEFVLAPLNRDS